MPFTYLSRSLFRCYKPSSHGACLCYCAWEMIDQWYNGFLLEQELTNFVLFIKDSPQKFVAMCELSSMERAVLAHFWSFTEGMNSTSGRRMTIILDPLLKKRCGFLGSAWKGARTGYSTVVFLAIRNLFWTASLSSFVYSTTIIGFFLGVDLISDWISRFFWPIRLLP